MYTYVHLCRHGTRWNVHACTRSDAGGVSCSIASARLQLEASAAARSRSTIPLGRAGLQLGSALQARCCCVAADLQVQADSIQEPGA